jgi:hypothetical protein
VSVDQQNIREMESPRTRPLAAVQPKFCELVAGMVPAEKIFLITHGEPVAVVTRSPRLSWPTQPGTAKDRSFWMAPDLHHVAPFSIAVNTFRSRLR